MPFNVFLLIFGSSGLRQSQRCGSFLSNTNTCMTHPNIVNRDFLQTHGGYLELQRFCFCINNVSDVMIMELHSRR